MTKAEVWALAEKVLPKGSEVNDDPSMALVIQTGAIPDTLEWFRIKFSSLEDSDTEGLKKWEDYILGKEKEMTHEKTLCEMVSELVGYEVAEKESPKNNGIVRKGITPANQTGICPVVYYDHFPEDTPMKDIADYVAKTLKEAMENVPSFNTDDIFTAEYTKKHVFAYLVNKKANEALIQEVPHRNFLDMVMMYRVDTGFGGTYVVKNESLGVLGLTEADLYEAATTNNAKEYCVINMSELIPMPFEGDIPMYVAYSEDRCLGSGIVFTNKLYELAKELDDDLIIIPSSIHELILLPLNGSEELAEVANMVKEVNATQVDPQDVLSDNVYIFSKDDRSIRIA